MNLRSFISSPTEKTDNINAISTDRTDRDILAITPETSCHGISISKSPTERTGSTYLAIAFRYVPNGNLNMSLPNQS